MRYVHFNGSNINHKGLQRTANEYAKERRIYKDLISKNSNVDILNSASRILQCWSYYEKINSAKHQHNTERTLSNRFIDLTMYSQTKPFLILYFGFGDCFEPGHPVIWSVERGRVTYEKYDTWLLDVMVVSILGVRVFNCQIFPSIDSLAGVKRGRGRGNLGARGRKERNLPSSLLPRATSRALIPFPFPFERLPRRLVYRIQLMSWSVCIHLIEILRFILEN